ncbi:hypothetical protein BDV98DRAFT_86034 [Pterulicium gracile]|uniref:Uncharacterized protein n=1 Tax=Pterulicium gracile TaxID=1884261 RepID=A0A5C3QFY0_9AGAR|nr:hypothetical protein BDV98DRAFT_86034 [Pterula gracilis]
MAKRPLTTIYLVLAQLLTRAIAPVLYSVSMVALTSSKTLLTPRDHWPSSPPTVQPRQTYLYMPLLTSTLSIHCLHTISDILPLVPPV